MSGLRKCVPSSHHWKQCSLEKDFFEEVGVPTQLISIEQM